MRTLLISLLLLSLPANADKIDEVEQTALNDVSAALKQIDQQRAQLESQRAEVQQKFARMFETVKKRYGLGPKDDIDLRTAEIVRAKAVVDTEGKTMPLAAPAKAKGKK